MKMEGKYLIRSIGTTTLLNGFVGWPGHLQDDVQSLLLEGMREKEETYLIFESLITMQWNARWGGIRDHRDALLARVECILLNHVDTSLRTSFDATRDVFVFIGLQIMLQSIRTTSHLCHLVIESVKESPTASGPPQSSIRRSKGL